MLEELFNPKLYNINFFYPANWFGYSNILLLGFFLLLSFLIMYYVNESSLVKKHGLMILIIIFSLPTIGAFFMVNLKMINFDFSLRHLDTDSKVDSLICRMDEVQSMGGFFCGFPKYLAYAKEHLPKGAKIKFYSQSIVMPFYNYYGIDNFTMVKEADQADFLLFYFFDQEVGLTNSQELIFNQEPLKTKHKWQEFKKLTPAIFIYKKI